MAKPQFKAQGFLNSARQAIVDTGLSTIFRKDGGKKFDGCKLNEIQLQATITKKYQIDDIIEFLLIAKHSLDDN